MQPQRQALHGTVTSTQEEVFFDPDGIKMVRIWCRIGDRATKLVARESAAPPLASGDEVIATLLPGSEGIASFYNETKDKGYGPRWKELKRSLGPWGGTRVVQGIVDHKERKRSGDDMSREGYSTSLYFRIAMRSGETFFVSGRDGEPVKPGHHVQALLARGGNTELDTIAFRDLTAGTDSSRSALPALVAWAVTMPAVYMGAEKAAHTAMDPGRWFILGLVIAVPLGLALSFTSDRLASRRALRRLAEAAAASPQPHDPAP